MKNDKAKEIIFTGHSLGGALATHAYLRHTKSLKSGLKKYINGETNISCYPMSAPAVIHGKVSYQNFSLESPAHNIYHHYCENDAVHGGATINESKETKLSNTLGWRHPNTHALHIGSEMVVNNNAKFPEAHELYSVREGLGKKEPNWWYELDMGYNKTEKKFVFPLNPTKEVLTAIKYIDSDSVKARMESWLNISKNKKELKKDMTDIVKNIDNMSLDNILKDKSIKTLLKSPTDSISLSNCLREVFLYLHLKSSK
jgi:hypothetical protein